jgi:hypothetical protein
MWLRGSFSKVKYGLRFKSARMWHCVLGQVVPKVLKEHDASIFWVHQFKKTLGVPDPDDEGTINKPSNIRNYLLNNTASHPKTLHSSAAQLWQSQMSASNWSCLTTAYIANNEKMVANTDRESMVCIIFQNVWPTNGISATHICTLWHMQVFRFLFQFT